MIIQILKVISLALAIVLKVHSIFCFFRREQYV